MLQTKLITETQGIGAKNVTSDPPIDSVTVLIYIFYPDLARTPKGQLHNSSTAKQLSTYISEILLSAPGH